MKTIIYYFSGTGNSLKVARDLADRLGETTLIAISNVVKEVPDLSAERIGIVFPVYLYGMPLLVSKFVAKIKPVNQAKFFFGITTFRAQPGGALLQLAGQLKSNGLKLSAGFNVMMPGNAIAVYERDSLDQQLEKFAIWEKRLPEIVSIIKTGNTYQIEKGSLFQRILGMGILYNLLAKTLPKWDKKYWIDANCNGCGICQKVCPVQNIMLQNKKPVWRHQCEQCAACINWCPKQAIQAGKTTIGRERYQNPYISLKDLWPNKEI